MQRPRKNLERLKSLKGGKKKTPPKENIRRLILGVTYTDHKNRALKINIANAEGVRTSKTHASALVRTNAISESKEQAS